MLVEVTNCQHPQLKLPASATQSVHSAAAVGLRQLASCCKYACIEYAVASLPYGDVTKSLRTPKLDTGCNLWKNRMWFQEDGHSAHSNKITEVNLTCCQGSYEHKQAAVSKLWYSAVGLTLLVDEKAGWLNGCRCNGTKISTSSRQHQHSCAAHRRLSERLREAHAFERDAKASAFFVAWRRNLNHCTTTICRVGMYGCV